MAFHHWPPRPLKPEFQRGKPIASRCVFAAIPGWERGFKSTAPNNSAIDWVARNMGFWTNTPLAGHNPAQYDSRTEFGTCMDNGDGAVSDSSHQWSTTPFPTFYNVTLAMTAAVLIRPDIQVADPAFPLFKRRAQPYGAAQAGWNFTGDVGNVWRCEISDGVAEFARSGTTVQDAAGIRHDLLILRATGTGLDLFVNGIREATGGTAIIVGNPAEDIKILGLSAANGTFPGCVGMCAFWTRDLSGGEVRALYTDPFTLWRPQPEALEGASAATPSSGGGVGDKNCPWSIPPMGWMNQTVMR